MIERDTSFSAERPGLATTKTTAPEPALDATVAEGEGPKAAMADPEAAEAFSSVPDRGRNTFVLSRNNIHETLRALEAVPRPAGVKSGDTYPVGTVQISKEFDFRTSSAVAAWYSDSRISPQEAVISRRRWDSRDSEPFLEPQGVLLEHWGQTLYGGVQVGEWDPTKDAGKPTSPMVSLHALPHGSVVKVGGD